MIGSQQNAANYQPLPDALIPGNLVPNRNLLGFGLIDAQNQGIQQRLQGIVFPNDDSIEGRYKVSHTACSRVYIILSELKDRFKMTELRRLENKEGLNAMEKLIPKIASANLTFVESEGPANPIVLHLYDRNVNVYSNSSQGSATANWPILKRCTIEGLLSALKQPPDLAIVPKQATLQEDGPLHRMTTSICWDSSPL